jgi:hypothetical protein
MIKPLFAKGKELERTFASETSAGSATLEVAAPEDFALGDRVFVANADGSALECVGPVTEVSEDAITVRYGLKWARGTTARVWRAQRVFQWETVSEEPVASVFRDGIRAERSVGGAVWSVRTGDPAREDTVRFSGVSRGGFAAFRAWLEAAARGGVDDFTWVDETRQPARVRLLESGFAPAQGVEVLRSLDLTIRLAVLEEGGYA